LDVIINLFTTFFIVKHLNNFFIYKVNKNELANIFDEIVESHKDQALEISKIVFDKPYQFLFIHPDSQRMFKNFDELIFSNTNNDYLMTTGWILQGAVLVGVFFNLVNEIVRFLSKQYLIEERNQL
jgi:hypothetical protein